ncbi:MAG TPA: EF-P lysine aminoacylase EpmA [Kiritimatiellia bacterium]|mgnify:CR=1 FL=1|nr:EF-P lysine aminoacylase EpmA [Kiritimatiellia bacterium]
MTPQIESLAGDSTRLAALRPALKMRSKALLGVRLFFQSRDFIEVETPTRLKFPALETHIDAEPSGEYYLRTSPELHMKRLLAAGYERIYQIGPCFRKGERGERHHPEYTMLEWYRIDSDYMDILKDTHGLVAELARRATGGTSRITIQGRNVDLAREWKVITVSEAFKTFAGWDPAENFDEDRFNRDLVEKVEPALPLHQPTILKDYPIEAGAFARSKPGAPHLAERWELYLGGLEIANAYSELIDPIEQESRFHKAAEARAVLGKPVYPIDAQFIECMKAGLPPCAGIALGLDRLLMVFAQAASLDEVMAFRE